MSTFAVTSQSFKYALFESLRQGYVSWKSEGWRLRTRSSDKYNWKEIVHMAANAGSRGFWKNWSLFDAQLGDRRWAGNSFAEGCCDRGSVKARRNFGRMRKMQQNCSIRILQSLNRGNYSNASPCSGANKSFNSGQSEVSRVVQSSFNQFNCSSWIVCSEWWLVCNSSAAWRLSCRYLVWE